MIVTGTARREPDWRPARRYLLSAVPLPLWDWLLDPGSLTQRLRQRCPGRFRVALQRQGWARPAPNERRALAMRPGERAVIREVHLLCGDTPWVFARTVIPVSTLRGPQRRLTRLGNKSLGAVLFADTSMRRGEVEVTRLRRGEPLHVRALGVAAAQTIWGRRSVFRLQTRPLLVSEFFLPALWTRDGSEGSATPLIRAAG